MHHSKRNGHHSGDCSKKELLSKACTVSGMPKEIFSRSCGEQHKKKASKKRKKKEPRQGLDRQGEAVEASRITGLPGTKVTVFARSRQPLNTEKQ